MQADESGFSLAQQKPHNFLQVDEIITQEVVEWRSLCGHCFRGLYKRSREFCTSCDHFKKDREVVLICSLVFN